MLKIFFIIIILYIILQEYLNGQDTSSNKLVNSTNNTPETTQTNQTIEVNSNDGNFALNETNQQTTETNLPDIINESNEANEAMSNIEDFTDTNQNDNQIWTFDKPNPWTKIVLIPNEEYPLNFFIKVKIPSLNDYQMWKNVVPNIDFNPQSGEIVIPSKDEASALALANLMIMNLTGQITMENILNNKLIQISISKAKAFKVVQIKFREQIVENLYGNKFNPTPNYHMDCAAKNSNSNLNNGISDNLNQRVDFTSENFTDTFEHFSTKPKTKEIEAYDGSDYTYI